MGTKGWSDFPPHPQENYRSARCPLTGQWPYFIPPNQGMGFRVSEAWRVGGSSELTGSNTNALTALPLLVCTRSLRFLQGPWAPTHPVRPPHTSHDSHAQRRAVVSPHSVGQDRVRTKVSVSALSLPSGCQFNLLPARPPGSFCCVVHAPSSAARLIFMLSCFPCTGNSDRGEDSCLVFPEPCRGPIRAWAGMEASRL